MRRTLALALAAAALSVAAGAPIASAASIGLHFYSGGTSSPGYLASGTSAGVVAQSNWNDLAVASTAGTSALTPIVDNSNSAAGSVVYTDSSSYTGGDTEGFATSSGNYNLYENELYGNTSVTVSSLTYGQYSVYVYLGTDSNDRSQKITLTPTGGVATSYYETVANGGGTFIQGTNTSPTATTTGISTTGDYEKVNYVVFTGITASSFTLSEDVYSFGQYHPSGLAGLQIVNTTPAVPEPATLGLLSLGGFALLRRRR